MRDDEPGNDFLTGAGSPLKQDGGSGAAPGSPSQHLDHSADWPTTTSVSRLRNRSCAESARAIRDVGGACACPTTRRVGKMLVRTAERHVIGNSARDRQTSSPSTPGDVRPEPSPIACSEETVHTVSTTDTRKPPALAQMAGSALGRYCGHESSLMMNRHPWRVGRGRSGRSCQVGSSRSRTGTAHAMPAMVLAFLVRRSCGTHLVTRYRTTRGEDVRMRAHQRMARKQVTELSIFGALPERQRVRAASASSLVATERRRCSRRDAPPESDIWEGTRAARRANRRGSLTKLIVNPDRDAQARPEAVRAPGRRRKRR